LKAFLKLEVIIREKEVLGQEKSNNKTLKGNTFI